jgi:lipoate-protein ligase A
VNLIDLTCPSPAENLACDEALLERCEDEGTETLRFWESPETFVVVGYGNSVGREVATDECARRAIPILRRCSGGGTVVQGPGCFNYTLALRIDTAPQLQTVTDTNQFIMEQNRAAIAGLLEAEVAVQGHTDLAFQADGCWWKFSGNAQRRRRRAVLFHGTILYQFDLRLIEALLPFPSAQPDYRARRAHSEFVRNIPVDAHDLRRALADAWAGRAAPPPSFDRVARLVREQYGNPEWNLRRH